MNKFKNALLPAVILLIAVGAAFAGHAAKDAGDSLQPGYYFDQSAVIKCVATPEPCSSDFGDVCTWTDANGTTHSLSRFISSTMCGAPLYKPSN